MKIIFNKAATDQLFTSTMAHNQTVRRRWRAFSLILSVIAGASVPVLGSISGRTGLSLLLVSIICGFFLPAFFRDFVPAFKFMPERASFLYAAIYSKSPPSLGGNSSFVFITKINQEEAMGIILHLPSVPNSNFLQHPRCMCIDHGVESGGGLG